MDDIRHQHTQLRKSNVGTTCKCESDENIPQEDAVPVCIVCECSTKYNIADRRGDKSGEAIFLVIGYNCFGELIVEQFSPR